MIAAPAPSGRVVTAVEHLDGDSDGPPADEWAARSTRTSASPSPPEDNASTQTATPPGASGAAGRNQNGNGTIEGGMENRGSNGPPAAALGHFFTAAETDGAVAPAAAGFISAADYGDRQRLLYHITYLSTQLQRAQMQLQERERVIAILTPAAAAAASPGDGVEEDAAAATATLVLRGPSTSVTAAVLAAGTEEELHTALSSTLPLFDPLLAQETIHRLDSALAQLSLLREAELGRLQQGETELEQLRRERVALAAQVDNLSRDKAALETENASMRDGYEAMRLEVGRLRLEEAQLVRKVAGLEGLMASGSAMDGVAVVGGSERRGSGGTVPVSHHFQQQRDDLAAAESVARQAVLQEMFWDPLLIAFDAGLTWIADSAALREEAQKQQRQQQQRTTAATAVGTPARTEANLPQLRARQEEELVTLQSRLSLAKERLRVARLEADRLRLLYEGEQRRTEVLAADHSRQMQMAHDEVQRDRALLAEHLRAEVAQEVLAAFKDGRRFERQRRREAGNGDRRGTAEVPRNPPPQRAAASAAARPPARRQGSSTGGRRTYKNTPIEASSASSSA